MGGHARGDYVVRDRDKNLRRIFRDGKEEHVANLDSEPETFAYTYIFGKREEQRYPGDEPFVELGKAMMADARPSPDSTIPAGYTYLGQFIFHDITYMKSKPVKSHRSPALDLDSVLGPDPATVAPFRLCPIGFTTIDRPSLPEDLPRGTEEPDLGRPDIVDERNDDFLPLAQCHMLLLKFYNAIARGLGHGHWPADWEAGGFRAAARKLFVQHFQSVVLHDYLPRIISPEIYDDVMKHGPRIVRTDKSDPDWLPIEFAAAIGRFGHSMIRDSYDRWSRILDGHNVGVNEFIAFSHRNSEDHLESSGYALPGKWTTNWFRQFDFSPGPYAYLADAPMYAARIDTRLAGQLAALPERIRDELNQFPRSKGEFNLASETLKRNFTLNMAPAQEAVAIVNTELAKGTFPKIKPLTRGELLADEGEEVRNVFVTHDILREKTPLWYYVLKEAQTRSGGNRLGPFGGRIVMETLHAAIEASEYSILTENNWRPSLPGTFGHCFTMPDLIAFSGNPDVRGSVSKLF